MARIWVYAEGLDAVRERLEGMGIKANADRAVSYALKRLLECLAAGLSRAALEPAYEHYVDILSRQANAPQLQVRLDADAEAVVEQIGARLESMGDIANLRWRGNYNKKLIVLLAVLTIDAAVQQPGAKGAKA